MTDLERFLATMEYRPLDRAPSHEIGVWAQTEVRWEAEGAPMDKLTFEWMKSEEYFGLDRREYVPMDVFLYPSFPVETLEETDEYITKRYYNGIVMRGLKAGAIGDAQMSMGTYLRFAIENYEDWQELKKRLDPTEPGRMPAGWKEELLPGWKDRKHVLAFPPNPGAGGFYWRAREFMGTERVSYSWYDDPKLMHEMMEFYADFMIEVSKPLLAETDVEYFTFNEDCAMKNGPLLSPDTFKEFIFEPLKRVVEFYKSNGVRYVGIDCDGAPELLVPMWMDAGIDFL
ncbi:MAG: uroporphyrinogen decarboxylase family protein, partial [Armatimonadota bacterium]